MTGPSNDFVDPDEDGFADDDLLSPDDNHVDPRAMKNTGPTAQKSFLERDNFENELGSAAEDPFGEDFSDISKHEIVDVFGEGDLAGRPVIVIYAYRFPSNKTFDHLKFLRFVQFTLDKVVEMDYSIIYFHYGLRSNNKPPVNFLIKAYQMLDRRYKKNLKALYLVHPTKFIRFVWTVFKPLISYKFQEKMHYVNTLGELSAGISVSNMNLPQPIIDHDKSISSTSKVPHSTSQQLSPHPPRPTQQFNVSLQFILDHHPNCDVPPLVTELIDFIRKHGMNIEGIFRRSATVSVVKNLQARIDLGEKIDFLNDPEFDGDVQKAIIHASVLLKTFMRSLGEPVITNALYPELALLNGVSKEDRPEAVRKLTQKMPPENYLLLKTVIKFLTEVAENSHNNLMDANNLSVVFGPNLTWPTDQQVPILQLNNLNNFCYTLIKHFDYIFESR
ncbi:rhoGAP domain-containing protein [Ditylenchus destructor]|nr:rhoGAP domain-containing protein [Ditylenchus destructor]